MKTKEQVLAELNDCILFHLGKPTPEALAILAEFEKQCEEVGARKQREIIAKYENDRYRMPH